MEIEIKRFLFVTWQATWLLCHMTVVNGEHFWYVITLSSDLTWQSDWKDIWLRSLWLLIIGHHPVKIYSHRARGSEDTKYSLCQMTSCNHVIISLCNFVNSLSSEVTALLILVVIGLTSPCDWKVTWLWWWWPLNLTYQPTKSSGHKSCESRHII